MTPQTKKMFLLLSVAAVIFMTVFLALAFRPDSLLSDGDTLFHIRLGERILNEHSIPSHDVFSYVEPPAAIYPHSWLAQLVMALIYRMSGLSGVVVFYMFLISLTAAFFYQHLRSKAGTHLAIIFFLAGLWLSSKQWFARPLIFTMLFMVIVIRQLDRFEETAQAKSIHFERKIGNIEKIVPR